MDTQPTQNTQPIPTIPTPTAPPIIPAPQPQKSPLLPIILPLLVLIFASISGYLYLQSRSLRSQLPTSQAITPSSTPQPSLDPTADWISYTNNSGFTIKYPAGLLTEAIAADGSSPASSDSYGFHIYKSGSESPYEERIIDFQISQIEPTYDQWSKLKQEIRLNGLQVTKISPDNIPFEIYSIHLPNKKFLEIYASTNPARKDIADQILSTFQFTN